MKKILFFLFILQTNCSIFHSDYDIIANHNYLNSQQKETLILSLIFFDKFINQSYSDINDENKRLDKFVLDFLTYKKGDKFENKLKLFEPYLQKLGHCGFFNIIQTNNIFIPPENDVLVKKWVDSIKKNDLNLSYNFRTQTVTDSVFFESINYSSNIPIIDSIYNISQKTKYIGNMNKFMLGLREQTKFKSDERKLIDFSVSSMSYNIFIQFQSDALSEKLSNPIIKSIIFYNTILTLFNTDCNCIN